ncbi:MAG: hypothetical protein J0I34_07225 [Pseudonocardia sp.]|uniref:hypothetical protein n=1 Tax=Actinomycetes TaxID=1760 RepID=UPI0008687AA7|nr:MULTISPECIES: hypothetical protein [Actinomycetes]MBN9108558.1 hypothetical protein [Pseudonocardia sp.]ODU27438.1 MAG: hypothetical protein ABS80_03415 [Pseudonocardia sp. SCN 72-51]ODV07800.1 MAG: hypothetical protein ABT15_06905 [Pseudonocardia sp. SCN 73-27]
MARHELDLQALAFRDVPPEQVTTDDMIGHFVVRGHEPLRAVSELTLPGEYELAQWDLGREDAR